MFTFKTLQQARRVLLLLVGACAFAAPAQAATIGAGTPQPVGEIVVPQQILDLAPQGTPVRDAAVLPHINWQTAPRLRQVSRPKRTTCHRGAGSRRCRHIARAAGDYGIHFISPDASCAAGGVTLDYRDFWLSSISSDIELMMVQDYAFYWDGRAWTQYSTDQVAWSWSGYQLATGWKTMGAGNTVVDVTIGDGVRFGTRAGAAIKIVQGIVWLDGSGRVISSSYRALDHRVPGWFDFSAHAYCQY